MNTRDRPDTSCNVLLTFLNRPRRRARWPLKALFLGVVILLTLYPNPMLLVQHAHHWSNLGAMIDPDEPAIQPLVDAVRVRLAANPELEGDSMRVLCIVEEEVYARISYAWDWEVWGCIDYLPTAAQAIELGREDCDGRAVVAASVLRKLGHDAQLVTDGSHMWVRTNEGESMSPMPTASGRTMIQTSAAGASFDPLAIVGVQALLIDWPQNLGFGAAVFPPLRIAIIALAVLSCCWPAGVPVWRVLGTALLAAAAIAVWRWACSDPWQRSLGGAWGGIGLCFLSIAWASLPKRSGRASEQGVPANS